MDISAPPISTPPPGEIFSKKFFRVAPPCQSSVDYLFTEDPFKNFGSEVSLSDDDLPF